MASIRRRTTEGECGKEFISILQVLDESSRNFGDDLATIFFHDDTQPIGEAGADSWSWRELRGRALAVAGELSGTGMPMRGARVLLVYPAGLGFLAAFIGCLYSGAVPVPVPAPRRSEGINRWLHIARDAEVSGVLCAADAMATFTALVEELGKGFCVAPAGADPERSETWSSDAAAATTFPKPDELAFLQYTSGSTSEPKGVMVTHAGLMANLDQIRDGFGLSRADRMACWLPHYHDMGLVGCLLSAVYNGFPIALMAPASFLRRPSRYLALATHFDATIIGGPNFAYDHCVRKIADEARADLDLGSVRVAFNGAETIRGDTLRRFHEAFSPHGFCWEAFLCCYGMAEATLYLSGNRPHDPPGLVSVDRDALTAEGRIVEHTETRTQARSIDIVCCGSAANALDIAIVGSTGHPLPEKHVGEIWVRGANLALGYWNRAELNGKVFDQALAGEGGWFRTGDLGFLHGGELYVTGRLKDMIVIRGQNHYPQDLERSASTSHPSLIEGMAGAFAVERNGEECVGLVCEVSRAALRGLDAAALFTAIRGAVSREHDLQLAVLALIKPGSLPRTPSGKVRRFACRERFLDGSLPAVARWEADFDAGEDRTQAGARSTWLQKLQALPNARRAGTLRDLLRAEMLRLASLSAGDAVSDDAGFFELGLDSVAVVEIGAILERELGLQVEPTVMFEHPTLSMLVDYLIDNIVRSEPLVRTENVGASVQPQETAAEETDIDADIAAEIAAIKVLLQPMPTGKRHV